MLTCSYGPDIEDITLEMWKLSNTSPQFLMWTSVKYVLNKVDTEHCGDVFADLASTM